MKKIDLLQLLESFGNYLTKNQYDEGLVKREASEYLEEVKIDITGKELLSERCLEKMDIEKGLAPMEGALCCFTFTTETEGENPLFVLGSLVFDYGQFMVKIYGEEHRITATYFNGFMPILNEKGGFYFIKYEVKQPKPIKRNLDI